MFMVNPKTQKFSTKRDLAFQKHVDLHIININWLVTLTNGVASADKPGPLPYWAEDARQSIQQSWLGR